MKKGQAAMEFLMTYGWAILVVLVAIGALAYFGVLNPSRFLPSSCTVAPGIGCDETKIVSGAGTSTVVLTNGMGVDLTAVTVSLGGTAGTGCNNAAWADGDTITCTWTSLTSETGRYKEDLSVSYTESGSSLNHTKTGQITTKIE